MNELGLEEGQGPGGGGDAEEALAVGLGGQGEEQALGPIAELNNLIVHILREVAPGHDQLGPSCHQSASGEGEDQRDRSSTFSSAGFELSSLSY